MPNPPRFLSPPPSLYPSAPSPFTLFTTPPSRVGEANFLLAIYTDSLRYATRTEAIRFLRSRISSRICLPPLLLFAVRKYIRSPLESLVERENVVFFQRKIFNVRRHACAIRGITSTTGWSEVSTEEKRKYRLYNTISKLK